MPSEGTQIKGIFNAGFYVWNQIINVAMTLFSTSPTTAAGGSIYSTARSLFDAIKSISLPIAIIFFLIALLKDVVTCPPDQQARKFVGDGLRFGIMVGILANLWDIMGYVIQIADGVTAQMGAGTLPGPTLPAGLDAMCTEIDDVPNIMDSFSGGFGHIVEGIVDWFNKYYALMGMSLLLKLMAVVCTVVYIACAISVLSSAYQRVIKPLVIMPFACITVAMATGSGDASRVTTQYLKTFFGLCLGGAFMIVCVRLGTALCAGLITFSGGTSDFERIIIGCVECTIAPLITSGLIKSVDGIIARFM